jgi:putative transposase
MKFDPIIHHRRSIRLKGYDYRQAGGYFVTMVTQGRAMLFGEVVNGEMILNPAGEMIVRWWLELPNKFPNVNVDIFMPMPNHFHGNIFILDGGYADPPVRADLRVGPADCANDSASAEIFPGERGGHVGSPQPAQSDSPQQRFNAPLSQMIQWFKTMTTNEYIRGVKQLGWKPFNGRVWQRNYYEHIIRNDTELDRITRYIESNPARWSDDRENPEHKPTKDE